MKRAMDFAFKNFFLALCFAFSQSCTTNLLNSERTNSKTIPWTSPESQKRIARSEYKNDFFQLSNFYEPQLNKMFCGPATGTIVLNAFYLRDSNLTKPTDANSYSWKTNYFGPKFNPVFSKYSQSNFFSELTDTVKPREIFYGKEIKPGMNDAGLKIGQLAKILELHNLKTTVFQVEDLKDASTYKSKIIQSLKDDSSFVVSNFDRRILEQTGGGHISPVAAYDELSDSFLILDVNPVATEWFWVNSSDFFKSMNTRDGDTYRGFFIISRENKLEN